ncbi:hypothetical protein ACQ4PT_036201 [Festuca glaucescens]
MVAWVFRDMRCFNQALLAKQAWRLLVNPESPCARLLKSKYYPNGNLVDTVFTGNSSAVWKGVEYGLELLKRGIVWRVGTGTQIRVWRDPWIPREPTHRPISLRGECRFKSVSDFLVENSAWNHARLMEFFLPVDVEAILKIRASPTGQQDFLAWQPEKSGIFTVRSAYHLAVSGHVEAVAGRAASSRPDGQRPVWRLIWKLPLPEKMKIFAWKIIAGALATNKCMNQHHLDVLSTCPLCGTTDEDSFHVLVACPHAAAIWDCMGEVWMIPAKESVRNTGYEWLFDLLDSQPEQTRSMIVMMIWRIWQLQNDLTHAKSIPPPNITKRYLCSYFDTLFQMRQQSVSEIIKGKAPSVTVPKPSSCKLKVVNSVWPNPSPGVAALSVDGSFDAEGNAGTVMILRNFKGEVIFAACRQLFHCNDSLEAEIGAIVEGLSLALEQCNTHVVIQSDCASAIAARSQCQTDRCMDSYWLK